MKPQKTKILDQLFKAVFQPKGLLRLAGNFYIDVKYGGKFLGGHILNPTITKDHTGTGNTDYAVMTRMFSEISIEPDDVFVDVGCGKGRTFNWFLNQGYRNRLIGIELVADVAEFTRRRLDNYPQVEIVTGDIHDRLPDGSIYYLFNPFGPETMKVFADAVLKRMTKQQQAGKAKRPVILYTRCDHIDVFNSNPRWRTRQIDLKKYGCRSGAIIEPA